MGRTKEVRLIAIVNSISCFRGEVIWSDAKAKQNGLANAIEMEKLEQVQPKWLRFADPKTMFALTRKNVTRASNVHYFRMASNV